MGTVFNQKNHAFMKEIIIVYTIESIFSITKTKLHLFVFSSLRKEKRNNNNKRNVKKSQTPLGTPHTQVESPWSLEIRKGVCLRLHKVVADWNSAILINKQ